MIHDLRTILEGWEYEPGKISVRKIIGRDGREKIQTRVDLGVLQCESAGRPDGERPFDCNSLLEHHEQRVEEYLKQFGDDEGFELSIEQCRELRHEAHLFYQRYLAMFVLGEFANVIADTDHNLRVIDLCENYAEAEYDREAMLSQRAYVTMMNIRARAYEALEQEQFEAALATIDEGIETLQSRALDDEREYDSDEVPELRVLEALRREIIRKSPAQGKLRLRFDLERALAHEDYERAAKLRDQIRQLDPNTV